MSHFRNIARRIRHIPLINEWNWLWDAVRSPFERSLDPLGRGVNVVLGRTTKVRIPAEFSGGQDYENYEPEAISVANRWVARNPDGVILDVGCAIGIFSLLGLSASPGTRVIAFDSDLNSLQSTKRFCRHADLSRLTVVWGFLSEFHISQLNFEQIVNQTAFQLASGVFSGKPWTNRYTCLDSPQGAGVPTHSLDGLLAPGWAVESRPYLLKCDVEGAELLVLRGAASFLQRSAPAILILLSVHPPALVHFKQTKSDVSDFLESAGYQIELISSDHEEHWWCTKRR